MRRLQFFDWLVLFHFSILTYGQVVIGLDLPLITPPPQLIKRAPAIESISVPGSVCGYISADYSLSNPSDSETELISVKDHQSPVPLDCHARNMVVLLANSTVAIPRHATMTTPDVLEVALQVPL